MHCILMRLSRPVTQRARTHLITAPSAFTAAANYIAAGAATEVEVEVDTTTQPPHAAPGRKTRRVRTQNTPRGGGAVPWRQQRRGRRARRTGPARRERQIGALATAAAPVHVRVSRCGPSARALLFTRARVIRRRAASPAAVGAAYDARWTRRRPVAADSCLRHGWRAARGGARGARSTPRVRGPGEAKLCFCGARSGLSARVRGLIARMHIIDFWGMAASGAGGR